MKKLPVNGNRGVGSYFLVSNEDYERVAMHRWWFDGHGYLQTKTPGRKGKTIKLHRFILDPPKGVYVDHKNHDTLDNRRENLRLCNQSQNIANGVMRKNNTSGYMGITWEKRRKKWYAQLMKDRKHIHIGSFERLSDAIKARKKAASQYFGEFAT